MEELKRIIDDSEITKEDDALWPPPDRVGRQVCENDLMWFYLWDWSQFHLSKAGSGPVRNLEPVIL